MEEQLYSQKYEPRKKKLVKKDFKIGLVKRRVSNEFKPLD